MELFYLADSRNPKMLEDLKDEYIRRRGLTPVTEREIREFIGFCLETAVGVFNGNMQHIIDASYSGSSVVYKNLYIEPDMLKKKTRVKPITVARHAVMVALFKYTSMNKRTCGALMNRDHATVIHAQKQIDSIIEFKDIAYYKPVKQFFDEINSKYRPHRTKRYRNNYKIL